MMQTENNTVPWNDLSHNQQYSVDLILSYLEQLEIDYVFGIPGGAIEPFFDALARSERRNGPRVIVARHETSTAFMADGYNYYSGKLGVCCATTGPGVTNIITGVASAYANHVPLLIITAQTPLSTFGHGAFQESSCTGINTLALLEPCTRFNSLVSHPDQLERKLVSAITTAFQPTPGPVHLSIPFDVMKSPIKNREPRYKIRPLIKSNSHTSPETIMQLSSLLLKAKKCVFIIGENCANSIERIVTIAEYFNAQILTTPLGKGLISIHHHLHRGIIGFAGHQSAIRALSDPSVDQVICVGSSLNEWSCNGWDERHLLTHRLIHIDQYERNFDQTPMARLHVHGKINSTFSQLIEHLQNTGHDLSKNRKNPLLPSVAINAIELDNPSAFHSDASPIQPARLMCELPNLLPANTRYLADVGSSFAWAIHYLQPLERRLNGIRRKNGGLFRTCVEFASMGWAIGSAVGTALALKNQPVACITGDGSILMNGQEITVAAQEKLPIIFIVLNDHALGMVKHGQQLTGAEKIGYAIQPTDFSALAKSMGVRAFRIESVEDFEKVREVDFSTLQEPLLLDVLIDPDAQPPINSRTSALKEIEY